MGGMEDVKSEGTASGVETGAASVGAGIAGTEATGGAVAVGVGDAVCRSNGELDGNGW